MSCRYQLTLPSFLPLSTQTVVPRDSVIDIRCCKDFTPGVIMYRLDYCNSLLFDVCNYVMQQVQSIQNAATRLITGTLRCEHITPVLQKLHWLPVCPRVKFKLACLVHQLLAVQTPLYLASNIQLTTNIGRPQLRSASESIYTPCLKKTSHLWLAITLTYMK